MAQRPLSPPLRTIVLGPVWVLVGVLEFGEPPVHLRHDCGDLDTVDVNPARPCVYTLLPYFLQICIYRYYRSRRICINCRAL